MSITYRTATRSCGRCSTNLPNVEKGWSKQKVYGMVCPKCTEELKEKRESRNQPRTRADLCRSAGA